MSLNKLTVEEMRDLIVKGELQDPLVFLEAVMGGQDPRKFSSIYDLATEIDEFSTGDIPRDDWNELLDLLITRCKYQVVPLRESISAGKSLAEYLHPKRKQVDIKGLQDNEISTKNTPLTEEEIELFREKFNDEF